MSLQVALLMGLLAGVGMFLGDMVLYYSKDDYLSENGVHDIVEIMKKLKPIRLYIGGILGLITAFIYCIGYYHIVLMVKPEFSRLAWVCFFISCLGIICGGGYHAYVAGLGLISRHSDKGLKEVLNYVSFQRKISLPIMVLGLLI